MTTIMTSVRTVSIIIPVLNGERFLCECLDALRAQRAEAPHLMIQIVAVDNASTDHSAALIEQHYPEVRLLRNPVNFGFAGGCNQGLENAPADVAILLNQDTAVNPGWLNAIVRAFADPQVGVVGCKIVYPDGKTLQHAGGYVQRPLMYGMHYSHHEHDQGQGDESRAVEWVTGAAFAIRRTLIEQIGMFDENFWPGYFEDVDYCLRTAAVGFKVWYCADALLRHQETASRIDFEAIQRFYQRGRLRLALKHLSPAEWLNDFYPAEAKRKQRTELAHQLAYWSALDSAPNLLRLRTTYPITQAELDAILAALQDLLYQPEKFKYTFSEYTFSSSVSVIGSLVGAVRRFWYNVAAHWAVRHLQHQLEANNQLHLQHMRKLQRQIDLMALSQAALMQKLEQMQNVPPAADDELTG